MPSPYPGNFQHKGQGFMEHKATVILAPGFEEIEAAVPIDLLRRAGVDVQAAGLGSQTITGAHGLTFKTDAVLEPSAAAGTALVLPGGMPGTQNLLDSDLVIDTVKRAFTRGKLCSAICAAPRVLDKAGVLDGRRFTCYPGVEKQISAGTWVLENVVRDSNVITSRGAGTAILFSLEIIHYLLGPVAAERIAGKIVYERPNNACPGNASF
jgi:4-methyl-5(b-hydroxyethyl)-thiazole monophosphate biosynthesis